MLFVPKLQFGENTLNATVKQTIDTLFNIYKTQDFKRGLHYSTGRMSHFFQKAVELNYSADFYSRLKSYVIIAEGKKNNLAEVSLFWISKLPNIAGSSHNNYKVKQVNYLLEYFKTLQEWKVKDAQFKNEYTIYDKTSQ